MNSLYVAPLPSSTSAFFLRPRSLPLLAPLHPLPYLLRSPLSSFLSLSLSLSLSFSLSLFLSFSLSMSCPSASLTIPYASLSRAEGLRKSLDAPRSFLPETEKQTQDSNQRGNRFRWKVASTATNLRGLYAACIRAGVSRICQACCFVQLDSYR